MPRQAPYLARIALVSFGTIGVVSGAMILLGFAASILDLNYFMPAEELYHRYLRRPLLKILFSVDVALPWSSGLLDVCLLWLSLHAAVNIFVYRSEGVFLWGHIRKNYCAKSSPKWWGRGLCTLLITSYAFLATPFALAKMYVASFREQHSLFTSAYITLDPREISRYMRQLGIAMAILLAASAILPNLLS